MKFLKFTIVLTLFGFLMVSCSSGNSTNPSDSGNKSTPSGLTPTKPASTSGGGGGAVVSTPKPISASFNFNSMNTVLPDDVLQEVVYYGTGGGLDCDGTYTEPTIFSDPIDTELMMENKFVTCDWQANESIFGKIIYPDGKVLNISIITDERGVAKLLFTPSLSDPEGVYVFQISDGSVILESNAYFRTPAVPRVYSLSETQLLLHKFASKEKIRLFVYDCKEKYGSNCQSYEFKGWSEYSVGNDGNLLLNIPEDDGYYMVMSSMNLQIDVMSDKGLQGFISTDQSFEKYRDYWAKSNAYIACPDNLSTHINLQGYENWGKVNTPDGAPLQLYSNPRIDARVRSEFSFGQEFIILDGPSCYQNRIWWRAVEDWTGFSGYVVEYDGNAYYFETVQK